MIFAAFLAKIPRSINEVWSQHTGVEKSKNLKNRKNRLKHIRNMLGTIIGHVEVLCTPMHLLTYNLIFSFFGNIHEFRYFAIFAEFPKKIRQNIFQVWLGYLGAQKSQNFKNRENGLKHIRTMLETIIGHIQVLHMPISSLTCNPIFGDFGQIRGGGGLTYLTEGIYIYISGLIKEKGG